MVLSSPGVSEIKARYGPLTAEEITVVSCNGTLIQCGTVSELVIQPREYNAGK